MDFKEMRKRVFERREREIENRSWLREALEKVWCDSEVEQPCKKTSWRLRNGITPVSRRVKSNRRYKLSIESYKSAEQIWNDFNEWNFE